MTGIGVQQIALHRFAQQRLVRVLAVDVDQHRAQFSAVLQRAESAIDIGPAAPVRCHHAAQQTLITGVQIAVLQPGNRLGYSGDGETGGDFGAFAAVAYGLGVGPVAQAQAQCIQHDGFAGPGLAGNHGHSGGELHVQSGHDGVVADSDLGEHERSTLSFAIYTR